MLVCRYAAVLVVFVGTTEFPGQGKVGDGVGQGS